MNDFSTKLEIRIDWSEIDVFEHVNNVAISKYIQAARVNYSEAIGLMQLHSETKIGPILASTTCQFRKPLFYPGQVTIYSKVDFIKNTSFEIKHVLYNEKNEISAEAQDVIVFFDFKNNIKLIIPNEIREKIKTLERKNTTVDDLLQPLSNH
jgi:acyl-CoA thioester hydrolase